MSSKKKFIKSNVSLMNRAGSIEILRHARDYCPDSVVNFEDQSAGVIINLDKLSAEALNFIYDLVFARRTYLSKPRLQE
jgi:hypothetical protein